MMTSLVSIPGTVALHIPARGAQPVPLDYGDLRLTLLPADPPTRPAETVTLSIGTSVFILAKNSPVQRIRSKNEHPSFVFTPAPPEGGQSIGQVRIDMADSTSPEAWERTEEGCRALEAELKAHGVWEDKELFVDDEYETDGPITGPKSGWGEYISSSVLGGASWLVGRLTGAAEPELPTTAPRAPVTAALHQTQAAQGQEQSPSDLKSMAAEGWTQAGIAARGIGQAAVEVGGALGQQARYALKQDQPAPIEKDAPAVPAKDGAVIAPTDAPSTSATTAALDAPVAPTSTAMKEEVAAVKAEGAVDKKDDEDKKVAGDDKKE